MTNQNNQVEINEPVQYNSQSYRIFFSGWALKENEKTRTCEPVKRMTREVKHLLEIMFHTGTANPRQKMNAQQMHEELLQRAQQGELREEDVPKISMIQNWISGFSRRWKEAMALRSIDENEGSLQ
ncbi:unnamed protein product [Rhizophagus irregularis]|nr:unnamed protein product [Rhizophagus irregularis]